MTMSGGGKSGNRVTAALYWLAPYLVIAAFLLVWELTVRIRDIPPIYLPAPSAIVKYLIEMTLDGSMPYHLSITFLRIMAGFLVAGFFGILVGIAMGMSALIARIVDPWIAALYPLPKISLIPLLIIWLGTGESYKIVISAVTAFFPVAISTFAAIRQVDSGLMKAAKDLGANARQVQFNVVIPAALPGIFSGLQLGMGVTIIMIVAAEMIGGTSDSGMGYLLIHAGQVLETEKVFAGLIVLAIFGAVITYGQKRIDRLIAPWAHRDH
ncbi:MAG: ABC transporter permease subunit [Rhodopseudomonas sp.]|nr:ABC transporter permease subunit [Rhodopseudomonas sp.]